MRIFAKDLQFTKEQLLKVEEITKEHSLDKVAEYLDVTMPSFRNLREKNKAIKDAVNRGLRIKSSYNVPIYKSETEKTDDYVEIAQSSVNMQQREALQKFRKEFAARKRERDLAELKDLDIL